MITVPYDIAEAIEQSLPKVFDEEKLTSWRQLPDEDLEVERARLYDNLMPLNDIDTFNLVMATRDTRGMAINMLLKLAIIRTILQEKHSKTKENSRLVSI